MMVHGGVCGSSGGSGCSSSFALELAGGSFISDGSHQWWAETLEKEETLAVEASRKEGEESVLYRSPPPSSLVAENPLLAISKPDLLILGQIF